MPFEHPIPLVDLGLQTDQIAKEVQDGFGQVLARSAFVLGDEVAAFEAEFAAFSGVGHCVGVGNGTDALELGLRAIGVTPGDEVLVPTNSFVASAAAVLRAGAKPVLVDVDPVNLLFDVDAAASRTGPKTRVIMPVHLFGQMAPMGDIVELAASCGATVLSDAAQAQGATQNGIPAAQYGEVTATSFYPGKNLGGFGDGGAIMTDSADIAARLRGLRNHGSTRKYEHPELGFNSRLDTLQAVVLAAKLRRLASWNEERRAAAERYGILLGAHDRVTIPTSMVGNLHVWHLYVVQIDHRDRVLDLMAADGIGVGVHYPVPIHLQAAFRHLDDRKGDFPVAEVAAGRVLSLPIYPGITASQQERVATSLVEALARN